MNKIINKFKNNLNKQTKLLILINLICLPFLLYFLIAGIIIAIDSINARYITNFFLLYSVVISLMISILIYFVYLVYRSTLLSDLTIKKNKIRKTNYLLSSTFLMILFVFLAFSFQIMEFFF